MKAFLFGWYGGHDAVMNYFNSTVLKQWPK